MTILWLKNRKNPSKIDNKKMPNAKKYTLIRKETVPETKLEIWPRKKKNKKNKEENPN